MTLVLRATAAVVAIVIVTACSGTNLPGSPTIVPVLSFIGNATDATGDAIRRTDLVAPDLTAAYFQVANGSVTAIVSFAPGTLTPAQTMIDFFLDTDENAATGNSGLPGLVGAPDAAVIGWEYVVHALNPRGSMTMTVRGATQAPTTAPLATATATLVDANQVRFVFPLSVLGGDDGRLKFKVVAYQWLPDNTASPTDYMPDLGLAATAVR